jgi:hypothetical protein
VVVQANIVKFLRVKSMAGIYRTPCITMPITVYAQKPAGFTFLCFLFQATKSIPVLEGGG